MTEKVDTRAELSGERAEKFQDLQDHLDEKKGKYGKASTLRMAVDLAHERLQDLQKERQSSVESFEQAERKLKEITEV